MQSASPSSINNFNIYGSGRYCGGSDYSQQTTNHGTVHYHNGYSLNRSYRIFHNHGQYIEHNNGEVNYVGEKMNGNGLKCMQLQPRGPTSNIRNPYTPQHPPYPPISKTPPPNEGPYDDNIYGAETDRSHPCSAAPDINPPAIPKYTADLEAELRRLSPHMLEYVRSLERIVSEQGSDNNEPVAPQNHDRPRLRMQQRHDVAPPRNRHTEYSSPSVASPPAPTQPPDHEPTSGSKARHISHKNNCSGKLERLPLRKKIRSLREA